MNPILNIARDTINQEASTLSDLAESLDLEFEKTVQALYKCSGRIIVTGVGKSALIAQKIVATLNSTGSPSIYMHAADAAHGDLGMVTENDILICLSKSGETAELKLIIPFVKSRTTQVVAFSSNKDSFIMKNADFPLYIPLDKEAEPNNLAPTSSSTAQLALGDAIAIALLSLRGFNKQDFARFHPGGSLGKQLYLRVDDLWINNEKPKVFPETSLKETLIAISSNRLGATAVVDKENNILGIITDGDLRRMLNDDFNFERIKAEDIMTENPVKIKNGSLAVKAFQLLRENSITQILIHENGKYKGIIHLHDFIRQGFV